ncbi:MAG: hypothetical protein CL772_05165 [Chloroflexi bacterium]|nr:hypothetical protein [Chloroflexota bacterium]MBK90549.1 hypothetical protein [Chloroflexota bacterium]
MNRNGQFPSQNDLIKKLDLSVEAFKELIIDAQESGRDIRPDTFELNQYLKININEIEFGTDEKEPFGYKDFIHYNKILSDLVRDLDFSNDEKTEDILEFAGTIVNFLEILIKNVTKKSSLIDQNKKNIESNYEEVMSVYGEKKEPLINIKQLQISIDKFLIPFQSIFNRIGIIFESYDMQIEEPFNEQNIIEDYNNIDFNEIESFLKLFYDDQLGL